MRATVISLFLLSLFLPFVSALTFEFNSPGSAEVYENFSLSISASTSENYDIKIFVLNNETNVIISEIYNDGWKNPYYYLKSAFPAKSSFLVRATNTSSRAIICVRLRKTGGSSYNEECKPLSLSGSLASEPEEEDSEEEIAQENVSETSKKTPDFVPALKEASPQESPSVASPASSEVIRLNSGTRDTFVTKSEKTRLYAAYSFTALVLLLVIFLIFKKL